MARKSTSTTKKAAPRKKTSAALKEAPVVSARPQKPVFRAGTWMALLLLAALIGFTVYLNRKKESAAAEATPTSGTTFLFDSKEGAPSSIEIKPADRETVKVARNEKNVWALELPIKAEANQSSAEAGATQITALQVITPVDGDPTIFGLDAPAYVITVEFAKGKTHTLEVGDNTPTGSGYYARLDKDKMMIVSLDGIDSLLNLVNFPPYLNTPTPTALPATETPIPPTEAIPTLGVIVTPTP